MHVMTDVIDDCSNCGGTGQTTTDTCGTCNGTGHEPMARSSRKPLYIS